ncbi:replication factor-A protein [Nemania sp. FL0916]|nr:replication factor-A protein [Nemania sp. FL0916]
MSVVQAQQSITQGALDAIFNDPANADQRYPVPVLQCLQIKPLAAQQAPGGPAQPERYRVVLSDIGNYVQCMLATQANHVITDGQLARGCIVRVKSYQANAIKGKNILIILDLEVATELGTHDRIGEPAPFEAKPQNANTATTIGGSGFYGAKAESSAPVKAEPMSSHMGPGRAGGAGGAIGGGGGGGSKTHGNIVIYPIESLSPYAHKWTIKARVTSKSEIKTWHKASGEGKLFSVNLLDETGEIKATGFNEQCDAFFDVLQEGQVYYISTCRVNLARKQFSNLSNDYELAFERETLIEKAEDQVTVPNLRFNFVNIGEIQALGKDATVDVVGVLKDVGEVNQIISKANGRPFDKRDLTIVDDSQFSIRLTIWGKTASAFAVQPESVVAFKGVKVSEFGGRSLSLLASGTMFVDPDIEEAHRLKGWYDSQGRTDSFNTHNNMSSLGAATGRQDQTKCISQVKDENLGMENADYFSLKATITYIRQDSYAYPACSNKEGLKPCNKKVVEQGDGTWRCEKCDVAHARPVYRYLMSVNVLDHTGQLWLSCFDDFGRVILGMSADELMEIKENDEDRLPAIFEAANCTKHTFRCRAKMETFGDNQRMKYTVQSVTAIDYQSEALKLADLIKQFDMGSNDRNDTKMG